MKLAPAVESEATRSAIGTRLLSLDVFRGATVAFMILVNNSSRESYAPLLHAQWHGWTLTDLVFPFFLWIVGVAMTLSFARRVERGDNRGRLLLHVLRRSAIIFALGLFLNGFPNYSLETIRIPGVLQRIAVCYLAAAAIFLYTGLRGRIIWTAALLGSYWLMMELGGGGYERGANFANYVDGLFLGNHAYPSTRPWDPEGIVSTLPAIATTLFGILTGHLLRRSSRPAESTVWMFVAGNSLIAAGLAWDAWLPINKQLWTSSYAVFTAGLASVAFAWCYWLIDVRGNKRWTRPLEIYGMNAIAAYVFSGLLSRVLGLWKVDGVSMKTLIYNAFASFASPKNASLLYALANVAAIYAIVYVMYRRRWFVRF